jgi:hypothetical protein
MLADGLGMLCTLLIAFTVNNSELSEQVIDAFINKLCTQAWWETTNLSAHNFGSFFLNFLLALESNERFHPERWVKYSK